MLHDELIKIKTSDFEDIALWKIANPKKNNGQNVFLTHGTFSNRKICLPISRYLANLGYVCWIMEWRNHGSSSTTKKAFNFETISEYDIKSTFDYLFYTLAIKNIDCVTHSGGGICLTLFLTKNKNYISRINSISMFSCQSFGACHSIKNSIKILLSKYITSVLGYVPGKKLGLGPHNETYITMKQWFDWNLAKSFKGKDGTDYLKEMISINVPVLSISCKGDRFIAPKEGSKAYLEAFKNPGNEFLYCSTNTGYIEDYDHSRIIHSNNAAKEIWPVVLKWIMASKMPSG